MTTEQESDESIDAGSPATEPPTVAEPVGSLARGANKLDSALGTLELALLCAFLAALISVGTAQALASKLFGTSWTWSFDAIRYSVFFIAMTGAALSAQAERQIAMDFVTRMLSPRGRAWLRLTLRFFVIAMCGVLAVGGNAVRATTAGEDYELIPPELGLLALPIGAVLIGMHMLLHIVVDLDFLTRGELPPEPEQGAH